MSILSTTKSGKSNYITIHGANQFIEKATEQIYNEVFNHNWEQDWQANYVMRFKFDFHLNMKFKKQYNDLFSESDFICKDDILTLYYRVYKSEYEQMMHTIQNFYNDLRAMGFEPEDARMVLPNACCTSIVITMNVRSLLNFFKHRDCKRAQWEIRALAQEMMKICKEVAPRLFAHAGASCRNGKCSEGSMSCGEPYN